MGAGAAGCVVARRLADRGLRILLLEAGAGVRPVAITGLEALAALDEPGWTWPNVFASVGNTHEHGLAVRYQQGRGLGGGSAVNSFVLAAGDRADYDRWGRDATGHGWDWPAMAPWFARVRDELRPEVAELGPFATALRDVAVAAGHPAKTGSADVDASGYLTADLAVGALGRRSAADAYRIAPAEPRDPGSPSLEVRADSPVDRVVVEDGRAAGVALIDGSTIGASRVVLCAGALGSPRLLWRSGLRHPSLGRTVSDHPSFVFTVGLRPEARVPTAVAHPPVTAMLRWSSAGVSADDRGGANDLAAHVLDHVGDGLAGRRYGAVVVMLADPRSRGRLLLDAPHSVGDDPELRFDPGWLTERDDRARFLGGVRHVAELLSDHRLATRIDDVFIDDAGTPVSALDAMADEEAERWLVEHPGPVRHVASTLPVDLRATAPAGGTGLVGPGGGIRGLNGLHVIDASILPSLPSGNPQLPVMAVAERLSSELAR